MYGHIEHIFLFSEKEFSESKIHESRSEVEAHDEHEDEPEPEPEPEPEKENEQQPSKKESKEDALSISPVPHEDDDEEEEEDEKPSEEAKRSENEITAATLTNDSTNCQNSSIEDMEQSIERSIETESRDHYKSPLSTHNKSPLSTSHKSPLSMSHNKSPLSSHNTSTNENDLSIPLLSNEDSQGSPLPQPKVKDLDFIFGPVELPVVFFNVNVTFKNETEKFSEMLFRVI